MAEMGEEKELACSMCLNQYKLQNLETLAVGSRSRDQFTIIVFCYNKGVERCGRFTTILLKTNVRLMNVWRREINNISLL